jgi:hypothetical protein
MITLGRIDEPGRLNDKLRSAAKGATAGPVPETTN